MRKVVFNIDDLQYFKKEYKLTDEQMKEIFVNNESFVAIYTLYGQGNSVERYELTDANGNKINRNQLNGYQRGIVLDSCLAYFENRCGESCKKMPVGVINIEEAEVE